jgi:hypothetical protein
VEGAPATPTAERDGPNLLDSAVEAVEELAAFIAAGTAGDDGRLAPARIPTLLGVEESTPMGSARDWQGTAGSDSADEPRESALGCPEDPRRAVEAGPDGLASDGFEVHAQAPPPAVAGVAGVSKESRQGSDRVGFFTVPTATFRVLFVLVVLSHDRRRLMHFNVTEHPTAGWTARQLIEACGLRRLHGI